jgi:hypothetical protein
VKYGAQKAAQRRKERRGLLGWLVG